MMKVYVLYLVLLFSVVVVAQQQWNPKPEDFVNWMKDGGIVLNGDESFPELRRLIITRTEQWAKEKLSNPTSLAKQLGMTQQQQQLQQSSVGKPDPKDDPYFAFIPPLQGAVIPDGPAVTWTTAPCFKNVVAQAKTLPSGNVSVTLTMTKPVSMLCSDLYLVGTTDGIQLKSYFFHGTHELTWVVPSTIKTEDKWDLANRGIRFFTFDSDLLTTIGELLATVLMFVPETTQPVGSGAAAINLDFMKKYRGVTMEPRTITDVDIDESLIHDGDFFGVIRLDGLDPMLAWAMGSTTGHTTTALRMDGTLYIVESTVKDSYWPTNGIQKTPFQQWVKQARAASYNVVWLPLDETHAKMFDSEKAAARFKEIEGFDYGYHNLLFGWIDTLKDNYPCLPPDYNQCLEFSHVEVLFGNIDKLIPSITNLLLNQALSLRLNATSTLNFAEILMKSTQAGVSPQELATRPELDSYVYQTNRYGKPNPGPSMVCCVFVCNMWKAGGLFASIHDDFNCAEMTNWDDYALKMFNTTWRPSQCEMADPHNQLCQISGSYTLHLNTINAKAPYAHMAEKCPSEPPKYEKPSNC